MKSMSGTLLALGFVFFTLLSLLSVGRSWNTSSSPLADNEPRISELGLRFYMHR